MTAAVPSPPPIPERTAHDALCDRADAAARAMFLALPAVSLNVALCVSRELPRIRVNSAPTWRALLYADIYFHFAHSVDQFEAVTRFIDALRAIAASRGEEVPV